MKNELRLFSLKVPPLSNFDVTFQSFNIFENLTIFFEKFSKKESGGRFAM